MNLPGQPGNVAFKQYSGYIVTDARHGRALFYYFVEAESANPLSRPLTLWLNGGPGCSSLGFGVFVENGPFQPAENGLDFHTQTQAQITISGMTLQLFPKYKGSEFFLAGESYAGHYIPQLAALILEHNKQPGIKPINLKAIALGNPLLDLDISILAGDYLWAHGAISDETLMLKKTVCNDSKFLHEYVHSEKSQECNDVFNQVAAEVGVDVPNDDLLQPKCLSLSSAVQFRPKGKHGKIHAKLAKSGSIGDPCLYDRVSTYLNKPKVQKALHANTTHLPYLWDFCEGPLVYQELDWEINIIPLISDLIKDGTPVWIYSGDQDSKIPLTQTRTIVNNLAKELKLSTFEKYGNWYDNKQVGGWSQSFGSQTNGKNVTYLTFATVRGAGHEVPFTAPSQALTIFRSFLSATPLPRPQLITKLPGQPSNVRFKQYSGYIVTNARHGRALFYYFVEADSVDPLSRPLTLWLNGGPGCSSLGFGVFVENGPFQPGEKGLDFHTQTQAQITISGMTLQLFPKYKNSDFFLAGESYADLDISVLSGDYLWAHGAISDETLMLMKTQCNDSKYLHEYIHSRRSQECKTVSNQFAAELGVDSDDLLQIRCLSTSSAVQFRPKGKHGDIHAKLAKRESIGDPCLYDRVSTYLNKPKVQKALHANTTHLPYHWDFCEGPLVYQNLDWEINIIPLVSDLIKDGIPIWFYRSPSATLS
ncbi:hypothetical protein Tsubulata_047674 [Turnera subulata]|uniref:Carboxypeptidase n=1 Tax=Turnera subulata TaxID=218843 RepID=A0A9Q0G9H1_9ROSI|nr:hypothetical protein Tsubulata_047674 [Turnera subulata]